MVNITQPIGTEVRDSIDQIENLVAKARFPDLPEVDELFANAISDMNRCHVRVSVVGQVKAGKSSLINVLSGVEGLLPTEVNPWTAVITNLLFGHPDKPQNGGTFQLFSEDEWAQMLEGDKETRSLAEDLLPGFDTEILKQQVAEMQENARARLGALYQHLLGKKHKFNTITPEILERYVSAGYQNGNGDAKANAGRFSGITKSAEVYLPAGPFAIPVSLSDTPGINDPFLVRDEITTNSFRDTDIFVVAISVHQALSAADMALLKMLSRHRGKSILIYVNRIDEIEDLVGGVSEILETLESRLAQELEGGNYTLIAGSAYWGDIALNGTDADVEAAVNAAGFDEYSKSLGMTNRTGARKRLHNASGIPNVAEALSGLISEGPGAKMLSRATTEISVAMSLVKSVLQERQDNDDVALMDVGDIPAILEVEKDRLIERINTLADLADDMDRNEARTRELLLANGDVVAKTIKNTIDATLTGFIEGQVESLQDGYSTSNPVNSWSLDTAGLQQRVETHTIACYSTGREEMDLMFVDFATAIEEKITAAVGDIKIGALLENLPHEDILPGYKPKSTLVDVELVADRGWKIWKKTELTEEEASDRVKKAIRQEMLPGVAACCDVAGLAIAERTTEALARISNVKATARNMIVEVVDVLKNDIDVLDTGATKETIANINAKRLDRVKMRGKQLKQLQDAETEFAAKFVDVIDPLAASNDQAEIKAGA